jgi:hypothetical protein
MTFHWQYEGANVGQFDTREFDTQEEAESWLGENWEELAADGVTEVTLFEKASKAVYRMKLGAEV